MTSPPSRWCRPLLESRRRSGCACRRPSSARTARGLSLSRGRPLARPNYCQCSGRIGASSPSLSAIQRSWYRPVLVAGTLRSVHGHLAANSVRDWTKRIRPENRANRPRVYQRCRADAAGEPAQVKVRECVGYRFPVRRICPQIVVCTLQADSPASSPPDPADRRTARARR